VGVEEEAVFSLLQRAGYEHQIWSAFTHDSVWGFVYVEAIMDPSTIHLLRMTPGIIQSQYDIIHQMIDPSDWVNAGSHDSGEQR